MSTLVSAERITWQTYEPLRFDCIMPGCDNRATIKAVVNDRALTLTLPVCPFCLHVLGADGLATAMEG